MRKSDKFVLQTTTDVKIVVLFVLDHLVYPVGYGMLTEILRDLSFDLTLEFRTTLSELVKEGLIYTDTVDGEEYFMISEKGTTLAVELYGTLSDAFREEAVKFAERHVSLANRGITVASAVRKNAFGHFALDLAATDKNGEDVFRLTLTVRSEGEADDMKRKFSENPTGIYRAMLFSLTGSVGYLGSIT